MHELISSHNAMYMYILHLTNVKVKVKAQVYRLDQMETSLPTSQLPRWSLETAPLLHIELYELWQSQGRTFRKAIASSQLPINACPSAARMEP